MQRSQNGYPANDITRTDVKNAPGTTRNFRLAKGAPGWLLRDFAGRFDKQVEDIEEGIFDDWAYAERPIRGSSTELSNHASGTAIDLNATRHPLGARGTFTPDQVRTIRALLLDYKGCIRWGGDYVNRADEMHFEINKPRWACRRRAAALRVQRRLQGERAVVRTYTARTQAKRYLGLEKGPIGVRKGVKVLQHALNQVYGDQHSATVVDGIWGKDTARLWRVHERRTGVWGRPGVPDRRSVRALSYGGRFALA